MKKILASCLTSVALLGSLCFSSPLTQVHAEEIEIETEQGSDTYVPIELNVKEQPLYEHTVYGTSFKKGQKIQIYNGESQCTKFDEIDISGGVSEPDNGTFEINSDSGKFNLAFEIENINYIIVGTIDGTIDNSSENETSDPVKIDLSKTAYYTISDCYQVSVAIAEPPYCWKVDKTTKELTVGSNFELKLPEEILYNLGLCDYDIGELKINGESIAEDEYSKYINSDGWKASLLSTINEGDKISFMATTYIPELASIPDNTLLATYNSENVLDETYPKKIYPYDERNFEFPVEITITAEGKGDIIDEEDEINVSLNLTPEYKKLTSKGETYKIDANVEIDEDADPEAKESFEAMKQDGHFKVLFVSNDTNVATVAEDGTVTAVANGSTEILAYVEGYEDELFGISKVDVEIPEEVVEEDEDSSSYPKTGDNFMAVSAAILTLGLAALVIAFVSKKQKDVNEEK